MKSSTLLGTSGLALCAFLAAAPAMAQSNHVDANGMPTDHSTPAEQAQTSDLNAQVTQSNAEISAQDNNNQTKYQPCANASAQNAPPITAMIGRPASRIGA